MTAAAAFHSGGAGTDAAATAAWLILRRLDVAPPGPPPPAWPGHPQARVRAGEAAAAAALTVTAHCEKILAPAPPARQHAPAAARGPAAAAAPGPERGDGTLLACPEGPGEEDRNRIWDVNEAACAWFRERFPRSPAERYLERERGFTAGELEPFEPGYAPGRRAGLTEYLQGLAGEDGTRLYPDAFLLAAGLASEGDGRLFDKFRNRVMWPIRDHDGHLAGFGGRALNGATPKYLNTPETAVFRKGRILYGLWQARARLAAGAIPVVSEGYTDVHAIALSAGEGYAPVASLGTAFTPDQATALAARSRLPEGAPFISARDPDPAGMRAAVNDFAKLVPRHASCGRFAPLEEDPADMRLHRGGRALLAALSAHVPLEDMVTSAILARYDDPPGNLRQWGNYVAQDGAARAVARALADARGCIGVTRQAARVALATGDPWTTVYWKFLYEWHPELEALAAEAEREYDELPPEQRKYQWALPPDSPERYLAEGPCTWEPGPEQLRELADLDTWRDPGRAGPEPAIAALLPLKTTRPEPAEGRSPQGPDPPGPRHVSRPRAGPREGRRRMGPARQGRGEPGTARTRYRARTVST
jgi:DNA primase